MEYWNKYLNNKNSDLGSKTEIIDFKSTALAKNSEAVFSKFDPQNRSDLAPAYVRLYVTDNGLVNISWVYAYETMGIEKKYLTGQEVAEYFKLPAPAVLFNNLEYLVNKILDWCNGVLTIEVLLDDSLKRFTTKPKEWLGNLKEGFYYIS